MKRIIFIIAIFVNTALHGAVVGSNTAVSRQGAVTFPASDTNEMRGFAFFEQGFTLANGSTSCIFNDYFPIYGNVRFNNGTLSLQRNLFFGSTAQITSVGTIEGNGYQVHLPYCASELVIPIISGNLVQTDQVQLDRYVYDLDWSYDSAYLAAGLGPSSSQELTVFSFDGSALTQVDTVDLPVYSVYVHWHPSTHYLACGAYYSNPNVLLYDFNTGTETLSQADSKYVSGSSLGGKWHPSGNWFIATSSHSTKELQIFPYTTGSFGTPIEYDISPNRSVQFKGIDWSPSGSYLAIGTSSGDTDLLIYYFDEVSLTLTAELEIGTAIRAIDWSPTGSYIAAGITSGSERIRIYKHMVSDGSLQEVERVAESQYVYSTDWSPDGNSLAVARYTTSGSEIHVYDFNKTTETLTLQAQLEVPSYALSVRWSPNGNYLAVGDLGYYVTVFKREAGTMVFDNVRLFLHSDVSLQSPVVIKGACEIIGGGHTLDASDISSFIIDSDSSLLLQDITVKGITSGILSCANAGASLALDNTLWLQDSTYSFSHGSLAISGDVVMRGTYPFVWKSSQSCTIASGARWHFDSGMTFSYDPPTASNDLLVFEDELSQLYLYETDVHVTKTGLQLTKGTLAIEGDCAFVSEATVQAEGIMFGDGSDANNNFTVKIMPESDLICSSGWVVYNNVE